MLFWPQISALGLRGIFKFWKLALMYPPKYQSAPPWDMLALRVENCSYVIVKSFARRRWQCLIILNILQKMALIFLRVYPLMHKSYSGYLILLTIIILQNIWRRVIGNILINISFSNIFAWKISSKLSGLLATMSINGLRGRHSWTYVMNSMILWRNSESLAKKTEI